MGSVASYDTINNPVGGASRYATQAVHGVICIIGGTS
jgi:hypothetical protein